VGDHKLITVDVRVLSATNKDLKTLMEEGQFRDDLFYRIGVIPIYLPPLRERREDIPLLIDAFINRIRLKTHKPINGMVREALILLESYDWPGNVRELINVIEYAFVLCSGDEIKPDHLPANLTGSPRSISGKQPNSRLQVSSDDRARLLEALKRTGGNKSEAARLLGISRVTLWKRLKKYAIEVDKEIRG
jgi:two-component system, NtrC family, response regulator HydG